MRVLSKLPGLLLSTLAPAAVVTFALAGCSDSDDPDTPADAAADSAPDAAVDSAPDAAADSPSADGATEDSAVEDSAVEDAAVDGDSPDGEAGPPPPAELSSVVFSGSNWADSFMLRVFDVKNNLASDNFTSVAQDSVASASAGRLFVLERPSGENKVHIMHSDTPWKVQHTIAKLSDDKLPNPYQVVMVSADKAYVIMYGVNNLLTFNPSDPGKLGSVDLSAYIIKADGDNKVEPTAAVFDAKSKRLYVLLQRTSMPPAWSGTNEGGTWAFICHDDVAPLVVGIDTTTDKIVDINGAADGDAMELKGFNPMTIQWDYAKKNLVVVHSGCAPKGAKRTRIRRGLELVNVATAETSWALELPKDNAAQSLSNYVALSETQGAVKLDNGAGVATWHKADLTEKKLDKAVWNLPTAFVVETPGHLLGLSTKDDKDTGWDVVRYDLEKNSATEVLADVLPTDKVNNATVTVSTLK